MPPSLTATFIEQFVEAEGVRLLSNLLQRCQICPGREAQALCLLGAFRALLNSTRGRTAVLQDPKALLAIAQAIDINDCKCKIVAIEILSGLCFVPEEGHRQVLTALTQLSPILGERTRFQTLVSDLHKRFNTERETDRVRIAILGLINALLRTGNAEATVATWLDVSKSHPTASRLTIRALIALGVISHEKVVPISRLLDSLL
ncbi:hypothetical protein NECAME_12760 [Necator americanus]|uniref:Formin GTPase-binding domain-containing protein n=1 Tax=Necator americanus TaxID=51031 RepID=W2T0F6_NECAM|nr:hypothetical protein NECAME_12760 [Necator americanus]ETN74731.1 hypothetical protein NECAME_12760 [Necator americanus]